MKPLFRRKQCSILMPSSRFNYDLGVTVNYNQFLQVCRSNGAFQVPLSQYNSMEPDCTNFTNLPLMYMGAVPILKRQPGGKDAANPITEEK